MIQITPFTPLFFNPSNDRSGYASRYLQVFAKTDIIMLELIADATDTAPTLLINDKTRGVVHSQSWSTWNINASKRIHFRQLQGMDNGEFTISIGGIESEPFYVTDDEDELSKTALFQYSMKDNRQRTDVCFWISGMQYFFDMRFPGGFKDDGWAFDVDSEQFDTIDLDAIDLYSRETTNKTFTLGTAMGCPVWFAEKLNRILTCSYVYVDGVRYVRKEQNTPEMNQTVENQRSYIFTQQMQRVLTQDPYLEQRNQWAIRRVSDYFRIDGEQAELTTKPIIIY